MVRTHHTDETLTFCYVCKCSQHYWVNQCFGDMVKNHHIGRYGGNPLYVHYCNNQVHWEMTIVPVKRHSHFEPTEVQCKVSLTCSALLFKVRGPTSCHFLRKNMCPLADSVPLGDTWQNVPLCWWSRVGGPIRAAAIDSNTYYHKWQCVLPSIASNQQSTLTAQTRETNQKVVRNKWFRSTSRPVVSLTKSDTWIRRPRDFRWSRTSSFWSRSRTWSILPQVTVFGPSFDCAVHRYCGLWVSLGVL